MNSKDHKPITEAELAETVREVLLKHVSTRVKYQNKKPITERVKHLI